MKQKYWTAVLALALTLALLAGCGGKQLAAPQPDPASAPAEAPARSEAADQSAPEPDQSAPPENPEPDDPAPVPEPEPEPETEPAPEPQPQLEEDPVTEPEVDLEPAPAPEQAPESESEPSCEDGTYTAAVTLEGGTGRAAVESPAALRCESGQFYATIIWSSSNFDYMKVNGEKYELLSDEGNSSFEIPVAAFDRKLDVIADTVAMSEPHEVEYTLYFDSTTLQKQ